MRAHEAAPQLWGRRPAMRRCVSTRLVDECDIGIASSEAQLERLRLEAVEAMRQIHVAEADLAVLHARSLTSSADEAGLLALAQDLVGREVDEAFGEFLQRVRAATHQ